MLYEWSKNTKTDKKLRGYKNNEKKAISIISNKRNYIDNEERDSYVIHTRDVSSKKNHFTDLLLNLEHQ